MGRSAARTIYATLVFMHPRSFRNAFADEMLQIFDEAAAQDGVAWLLRDAAVSILRQRLFREPDASYETVPCCGVGLMSGVYPLTAPIEFLAAKLLLASLLTSLLLQIIGPI